MNRLFAPLLAVLLAALLGACAAAGPSPAQTSKVQPGNTQLRVHGDMQVVGSVQKN